MYRRPQLFLIGNAVLMGVFALVGSTMVDRSLADPEGFLGPAWVRLPVMLLIAVLADLLPRAIWRGRREPRRIWGHMKDRAREHWSRERLTVVFTGVLSFYVVYVSYRNLKSFLPMFNPHLYDRELQLLDMALFLGRTPAEVVHAVFGVSISAHVLSSIYLWFLPLVPITLTAWLIWARKISEAYWFAVAACIAWTLGTFSYYVLPTLGPGFEYVWLYEALPRTPTSDLMTALADSRGDVQHRGVEGEVQSIAGFASLHCAITLLLALMAHATVKWRWVHWVLWVNFGITIVATLYFGWHYLADDIAGIAIALVSFYVGGLVSGQKFEHHHLANQLAPEDRTELVESQS